jgi:hypothetical protein
MSQFECEVKVLIENHESTREIRFSTIQSEESVKNGEPYGNGAFYLPNKDADLKHGATYRLTLAEFDDTPAPPPATTSQENSEQEAQGGNSAQQQGDAADHAHDEEA